jgi:hypothetical protein
VLYNHMNKRSNALASWVFGVLFFLVLTTILLDPRALPPGKQGLLAFFCATMGALFTFFFTGTIAHKAYAPGNTVVSAAGGCAIFMIVFGGLLSHSPPNMPSPQGSPGQASIRSNHVTTPEPADSNIPKTNTLAPIPQSESPKSLLLRLGKPTQFDTFQWTVKEIHPAPKGDVGTGPKIDHVHIAVQSEFAGLQQVTVSKEEMTPLVIGQQEYLLSLEQLVTEDVAKIKIEKK